MTQLDAELEEAVWAEYHSGASDGGSENSGDDGDVCLEAFGDSGPGFGVEEPLDVDELSDTLQGLPAEDAIGEVREALKKSGRDASDANLLGILLKIFRAARDSALEGYDTWDCPLSYCDQLTSLCDRNFGVGGGQSSSQGFPANVVAIVYAECGRTLLLADNLKKSRELLEKAIYVFGLIEDGVGGTDGGDDLTQRQSAAASASLARVIRRSDGADAAQLQYLRALEIYAKLPGDVDTAEFLSETCDVMGDVQQDALSPGTLGLLADIASEKFGPGSDEHLTVLREVADLCMHSNRPELAAPTLACRARLLQQSSCGAWGRSEALAASEEAAKALEAALPARLQQGDLEGAIAVWEEAIAFREFCDDPDSSLVKEMRAALAALTQALSARDSCTDAPDEARAAHVQSRGRADITVEEEHEVSPAITAAASTTAVRWDDDAEEVPSRAAAASTVVSKEQSEKQAQFKPPSRISVLSSNPGSLRPGWMSKPKSRPDTSEPAQTASTSTADPTVGSSVNDAWD